MLSKEELLMPRWKVIADFPGNVYFYVGEIFELPKEYIKQMMVIGNDDEEVDFEVNPELYPAIFKKLDWWEEREFNELPKYVKNKDGVYETFFRTPSKDGSLWEWQVVHPTKEYEAEVMYILDNQMLPSTEEEYKKQTN